MKSVVIDQENPEGLDNALRIFASLLVRQYIAEKKKIPVAAESSVAPSRSRGTTEGPRLLDVDGLSAYLSLPKATIYAWVGRRRIPEKAIVRLGRTLRFDVKEIDAWVEQRKTAG